MRKTLKVLPVALLFSLPVLARAEAGYSSVNFLKIGNGARAAAMADSFTAVADDATALYWNPAGLALVRGTALSTTHGQWLQGVTNDFIDLSHGFEGGGGLGLGFTTQSVQSFNAALEDSLGNYAGTGEKVGASDWALSAAYGDRLGKFLPGSFFDDTYAGLKATLVGQNALTPVGNAVSFEAGFLHVLPGPRLALGLDVQNVGSAIQDRSQPVLFKAGLSWWRPSNFRTGDRLTLAADLDLHDDTGFHPSFGTEYRAPLAQDLGGALRFGLRPTDEQYGLSFLTFGAGISKDFNGFSAGLDYAFVPYGAIGSTHRFTLNLSLAAAEGILTAAVGGPDRFLLGSPASFLLRSQGPSQASDWALTLSDGKGAEVQRVSGEGAPPPRFDWDGKGSDGQAVAAGDYQASLTVRDREGRSAVSAPWKLSALAPAPAASPSLEEASGYMGRGEWDKALEVLQAAASASPGDAQVQRFLATCLLRLGRWEEAVKVSDGLRTAP